MTSTFCTSPTASIPSRGRCTSMCACRTSLPATPRDGAPFVVWRFKPGQRMQILVPVEKWQDKIVLPIDAIAQDGVETYVFRENGDHFVRQPVHVEFRDQFKAVIANDGSLYRRRSRGNERGASAAGGAEEQVRRRRRSARGTQPLGKPE